MILTFAPDGRYVLPASFDNFDRANWYQCPITDEWYTVDPREALRLRRYADETAEKELSRTFIEFVPWTGRLPHPKEVEPKYFQYYAAEFALSRNRSYLALDMGVGKTICAALIFNATHGGMVYICPPYLVDTVAEEFEKWGVKPLQISTLTKKRPLRDHYVWIIPDSQIHDKELRAAVGRSVKMALGGPMTLVVDEAHRFKSLEARRTRALFQAYVPAFSRVVFMSGTPMPSRPMELYPVLSECAPECIDFMSETKYGQRYCGGQYVEGRGWEFKWASNVKELADRIHGKFMLRLKKENIMPELPPKHEEVIIVGRKLPPELVALETRILRAASPDDLVGKELAKAAGLPDDVELPLSTYRCQLGALTAKAALPYIRGTLEDSDENYLIFAFHKEAIEILKEGLADYKPCVVTGSTNMDERHRLVKLFQAGGKRVFIGNYLAAGTGFTLTKATRVLFVEYSWVPGENDQAADRTHRIGQTSTVFVRYLAFKDSLSFQVLQSILKKRKATQHV